MLVEVHVKTDRVVRRNEGVNSPVDEFLDQMVEGTRERGLTAFSRNSVRTGCTHRLEHWRLCLQIR